MTCAFLTGLLFSKAAFAQDVTIVDPLSFGTFGVRGNDGQYTIIVQPDNQTFYDSHLLPSVEAERAELRFTGLPANVTFLASVSVPNPPTEGGMTLDGATAVVAPGIGGSFTVSDFTATDLSTDNLGAGTMYIGATLTTSGMGSLETGNYNGSFDITLHY